MDLDTALVLELLRLGKKELDILFGQGADVTRGGGREGVKARSLATTSTRRRGGGHATTRDQDPQTCRALGSTANPCIDGRSCSREIRLYFCQTSHDKRYNKTRKDIGAYRGARAGHGVGGQRPQGHLHAPRHSVSLLRAATPHALASLAGQCPHSQPSFMQSFIASSRTFSDSACAPLLR